jgi:hypothetical protein
MEKVVIYMRFGRKEEECVDIPQQWVYAERKCPQHLLDLMDYKSEKEKK